MLRTAVFRRFWWLCLAAPLLAFGPASRPAVDLSSPELAFGSLVLLLQEGDVQILEQVATPTGVESLQEASPLARLGLELSEADLEWSEITEDIYFLRAQYLGEKTHKLEFTREEPGWMLYHWQAGGGVDLNH